MMNCYIYLDAFCEDITHHPPFLIINKITINAEHGMFTYISGFLTCFIICRVNRERTPSKGQ